MAHVRYINCLFWELRDNGVVNNLQFSPESLHVMLLRICINILNVGYSGWQGRQTGIGRRGVGWGGMRVGYLATSVKPAMTKKGVLTVF